MIWKWTKGRQEGTDYKKFTLWKFKFWKFGFDAYILKYQPLTTLDWHIDPVYGGEHYRFNKTLKGSSTVFIKRNERVEIISKKSYSFRPDLLYHKVCIGVLGATKLSLGFVKFK